MQAITDFFKGFVQGFLSWFFPEPLPNEVNNRLARKHIYNFFVNRFDEDESHFKSVLMTITNVRVFAQHPVKNRDGKTEERTVVQITTQRPGLVIGKGGSTIEALSAYLKENLYVDVYVELVESDLWKNLYNSKDKV